jgi:dephospho-CoA kinase
VQDVLAAQASREARRAAADAVILNDGLSLAELRHRVAEVWHRWVNAPT